MKYLVLIFLVSFTLTAAQTTNDMHRRIEGVADLFSITYEQAEMCISKMSTTFDDLTILEDAIFERINADKSSVRRASCALVCCAQKQGTMTGAKIETKVIQEMIHNGKVPPEVKYEYSATVDKCVKIVKDITDECDVGLEFVKCIAENTMRNARH